MPPVPPFEFTVNTGILNFSLTQDEDHHWVLNCKIEKGDIILFELKNSNPIIQVDQIYYNEAEGWNIYVIEFSISGGQRRRIAIEKADNEYSILYSIRRHVEDLMVNISEEEFNAIVNHPDFATLFEDAVAARLDSGATYHVYERAPPGVHKGHGTFQATQSPAGVLEARFEPFTTDDGHAFESQTFPIATHRFVQMGAVSGGARKRKRTARQKKRAQRKTRHHRY